MKRLCVAVMMAVLSLILILPVAALNRARIDPDISVVASQAQQLQSVVVSIRAPAVGLSRQAGQATRESLDAIFREAIGDSTSTANSRNYSAQEYLGTFGADLTGAEIAELSDDSRVEFVSANRGHVVQPQPLVPNVNAAATEDPLKVVRREYGITDLTTFNLTGAGQYVAVIDTGVDYAHPFLSGPKVSGRATSRVVEGACFNTVRPAGYVSTCGTSAKPGANCSVGMAIGCIHGTHVAGIIAGGRGDGSAPGAGQPVQGIAPNAKIVPINIFSLKPGTQEAGLLNWEDGDLLNALNYILGLRAKRGINVTVVNMSIGDGTHNAKGCDSRSGLAAAFRRLASMNIALVASAGNHGYRDMERPACYTGVTDVANVRFDGKLASNSNFGEYAFPGDSINSSVPGGRFAILSGTSQAAAVMAGAFALLSEANSKGLADLTKFDAALALSNFYVYADSPANCDPLAGLCTRYTKIYSPHIATVILGTFKTRSSLRYLYTKFKNPPYVSSCGYNARTWQCNGLQLLIYSIGAPTKYSILNIEPSTGAIIAAGTNDKIATKETVVPPEALMPGIKPGAVRVGTTVKIKAGLLNQSDARQAELVSIFAPAKRVPDKN